MRKLLQQIKRELKTAKHCAVYEENSIASGPMTGISANKKSRDLLRRMAFACGFIVTVCARFLIENPPSAAKSNLSARVQTELNTHR